MPPRECKVVKDLLPNEKHLLKLYEKRERLKQIKESRKLSHQAQLAPDSAHSQSLSVLDPPKASYNKKQFPLLELDQEVEQLVFNQLDKVIRPEASGGQLDLSKNEFRVNDKFSIQKAKQLHQSRNANSKLHAKSAYSDLSNDVYDGGIANRSRQNNNLSIQSQEHVQSFRSESKKYDGKISHQ